MVQQQLFAKQSKNDQDIAIGNGYSVEWVAAKIVRVYRYGVPFKVVEIKAGIDRRRLVIELVLEGAIIKSRLAQALKISRQSIDTWIDTFKKSGFEGLVNSYKGNVRTGRVENSAKLPVGNKARQLEETRRLKREEIQEQQLIINFDPAKSQSETPVNSERLSIEQSTEAQNSDQRHSGEDDKPLVVVENTEEKDSSKISEPKIANLFEDSYDFRENRYAGSFVYWAIFQHVFNLMGLCDSILRHYSIVIYLFAMMLINDIASIEQLKTIFRREFGNLIGIKQLLSKPNIWKLVHNLCHLGRSRQLIEDFFHFQAKKSLVALYWLYIDGHFVPYYGKERIHSGFYTQRDQMMPGQTEMYVHDCQGQIVYFEIQEGKGDLKEMIRRMSEKWSAYIGDTPPLIIADRESWGVENFLQMRGYRFVTWEKFSKAEELSSIADDKFGAEFQVNSKIYQVFEDKKTYRDNKGNSIDLRRIIIWNKETNKRVACVCQDEQEDAITIVTAMLGRWGSSENSFKHMGFRFNMHYNPVVDTSMESESQDIVNPKFKQIKKEISRLRKLLVKCERQLARLPMTKKKDGSLRKSNKREKLQKELKELKDKIAAKQEELANCPERVDINEVKPDATFKVLSTEGKNLWNLTEALVWNSRKKLVTKSRGWIRSTKEVIEIRLEPLETKRFEAAQIQLCRYFNENEIRLANGKRLLYDVGPDPTKIVQ